MENLDQIFNPESNSFWNLLLAAAVIGVSLFLARVVRRKLRAVFEANELEASASALVSRVAGWTTALLGVVLALSIMGVDMLPFVLIIVVIVVLLVLSGKSLVENWAAGLLLQARGPYGPGDRVDTNGYSVFVQVTNLRTVVLRTGDGQIVHVPNVDVLTNPLVNRSGDGMRRSSLTLGVAYGSDLDAVQSQLVDVAASVDGVITESKPPTAWIDELGDTAVGIELQFWHMYADRRRVRSDVAEACLRALDESGVSLPFPTNEVVISGRLERVEKD